MSEADRQKTSSRYVRWQSQAIAQLSFAINLFATLSVGALGFGVSLLRDVSFHPTGIYACAFLLSLVVLLVSALFGVSAVITRLIDFKRTAHKIRLAQKGAPAEEIEAVGAETKRLGKATWCLFWLLLVSFGLGVAGLVVSVFGVYASRLLDGARP